jgi:hypothetical protein
MKKTCLQWLRQQRAAHFQASLALPEFTAGMQLLSAELQAEVHQQGCEAVAMDHAERITSALAPACCAWQVNCVVTPHIKYAAVIFVFVVWCAFLILLVVAIIIHSVKNKK